MLTKKAFARASTAMLLGATLCLPSALSLADEGAFVPKLVNSSTIPDNGDVNPYGVAFVPKGFPGGGAISAGDVLVSNFNNSGNSQGTGTTIIQFTPGGMIAPPPTPGGPLGNAQTFYSSPLGGLSTALGVLRGGVVIVGNVPTTDGTFGTIGQGALQVIDKKGKWLQTLTDATFLDSPWDLALDDDGTFAHIFVSNVLSGTVTRLDATVGPKGLTMLKKTTLATGYKHEPNGPALVVGPTGLAFDETSGALYVASTDDNAIYVIWNAATATHPVNKGMLVFDDQNHLRGPLALRFAPNGHLLTANGDAVNGDPEHPSEIVEFTKFGQFIREYNVDAGQGGAFGLDTVSDDSAPFNYAAIDDVTNSLAVYRLNQN